MNVNKSVVKMFKVIIIVNLFYNMRKNIRIGIQYTW